MTTTDPGFRITVGAVYRYIADWPVGCKDRRYRILSFVLSVPSYQEMVLVKALDGPDQGLIFVASPANFAVRYKLDSQPEPAAAAPAAEQPTPRATTKSMWG